MSGALLAGIFAGYAIAVPVGVIAVLIIETGMAGGLRRGLAAGAGAATVDLVYCAGALGAGGLLIIQDDQEAALPLPRTYGTDDIPLVLTSDLARARETARSSMRVLSA